MTNILFTWNGLPFYGARCLRAFRKNYESVHLTIVATQANVPFATIDEVVGQKVNWVSPSEKLSDDLAVKAKNADLVVVCGWATPVFQEVMETARRGNAAVILFADNNWQGSFRQLIGAMVFRLWRRKKYDAVWVPGKSGRRLFRFYGMKNAHIYEGLYTADSAVFFPGSKISERPKQFLFTGQLVVRKGVLELCKAFEQMYQSGNCAGHRLVVTGTGPLEALVRDYSLSCPAIEFRGFVQPKDLAELLRESRALILPSWEEHWGLVVHEAALSGCIPVLSKYVGALPDLLDPNAIFVINSVKCSSIRQTLEDLTALSEVELEMIGADIESRAACISVENWVRTISHLLGKYAK